MGAPARWTGTSGCKRVISGQHAKETGYVLEADISWSGKDDKP